MFLRPEPVQQTPMSQSAEAAAEAVSLQELAQNLEETAWEELAEREMQMEEMDYRRRGERWKKVQDDNTTKAHEDNATKAEALGLNVDVLAVDGTAAVGSADVDTTAVVDGTAASSRAFRSKLRRNVGVLAVDGTAAVGSADVDTTAVVDGTAASSSAFRSKLLRMNSTVGIAVD